LALGRVAHDAFAGLGERHDGRRGALALGIFEYERFESQHRLFRHVIAKTLWVLLA